MNWQPSTDKEKQFSEAYMQSWSAYGSWQTEARRDIGHYLGAEIYTAKEKRKYELLGVDLVRLQLIRRIIKWVAGYQRDHRLGIKFNPVEGSDDRTASDFTELITMLMQSKDGYNVISDGFEHALKTGLSLVNVYNDQNYDTHLALMYYNQFLLDPNWTRIDLADCQYGILRKYITKDQAKILLPKEDHSIIEKVKEDESKDDKFPNFTTPRIYGEKLLAYDEFQQKTSVEKQYVLIKPLQRELPFEGSASELKDMVQIISAQSGLSLEQISTITRREMSVEVTGLLNGREVRSEVDPFGIGDFSFTPIIAFYDPEYDEVKDKLQGLVRCLVEPQRAENKRFMAMINWFDQHISSGVDYEEDSLVDEEDAFVSGPGKPRKVKKGKIDAIRDRIVQDLPQGMVQLSNMLTEMMPKMVNMNEEMFGEAPSNAQIAGIVQQLRMGSGLVGLRGLFDNLSLSQKIIGQKTLKLQQQYPVEKVRRLINKEPSQEFYNRHFGQYDAVVSECALTATQINTLYAELVNLKRLGAEIQDPAPISWRMLLKYAPIQMREDVQKQIEQEEQAKAQRAAEQAQIGKIIQQLDIQNRQAELQENQTQAMERRTAAVENMANAALDRVKTAAELQNLQKESNLEKVDRMIEVEKLKLEKRQQDIKLIELDRVKP